MDQQITFGKFQGWTPLELAQAGEVGRGYLSWGADNLKSPQWRRAFEEALHAQVGPDVALMARAIMKDANDLSHEEAMSLAQDELAQDEEIKAFLGALDARQTAVVTHWAQVMGTRPEKLRGLARRYEWSEWEQLPVHQFSSPAMHQHFLAFMQAWHAAYEEE